MSPVSPFAKKTEVVEFNELVKTSIESMTDKQILDEMGKIEREFGSYGDIPRNHDRYWALFNRHNFLNVKP